MNEKRELRNDAIMETPIEVDWQEAFKCERAELVYPIVDDWDYQQCREILADRGFDLDDYPDFYGMERGELIDWLEDECHVDEEDAIRIKDHDVSKEILLEQYVKEIIEEIYLDEIRDELQESLLSDIESMMNFAYPLPIPRYWDVSAEELQAKVCQVLPLTIVRLDDELYLALTGGGMDLSWEICEAYILLGFLPPYHFCDLPRMAGRGSSERDRGIIAACKRTCELVESWAVGRRQQLEKLENEAPL